MSEPAAPLDIRDPGLTDVLGDAVALSLWELLRRARASTSAAVLADAADLPLKRVHDCLDRLREAGLVEQVKATSRRPTTGWRTTRETIIVGYRVNDPLDEVLTGCLDELFSPEWRRWIEKHIRTPAPDAAPGDRARDRFAGAWAGRWSREERRPFWDLMLELPRLLHASTARFLGAPPSKAQMCTHLLEIHLSPLEPGVPQWPQIRMVPIDHGVDVADGAPSSDCWILGEPRPRSAPPEAAAALSKRERSIARLIASGRTRDEIAAQLGLAAGTVASHVRAVHRKLGVDHAAGLRPIVERWARDAEASASVNPAAGSQQPRGDGGEPAAILDLRLPGLAEVLGDGDALAVWEHVRRRGSPMSAAELAEAFGWDQARIDAALRSLAAAGPLAVEEGAAAKGRGGGRGEARWRVAREAIVVGHRIGDAADEAIVAELERVHGEARRRTVQSHAKTFKTRRADEEMYRGTVAASLVPEELQRIEEILGSLERHFRAAAARGGDGTPSPPWCTYRLTVSLEPLTPGILPQPTVQVVGMQRVDEVVRSVEERIASLSNRERTVALALRDGLERRRIAESLGVSRNTVATLVKRLYAKLGVRSRTELAKRLGM